MSDDIFDSWNEEKKRLHRREVKIIFSEGEIWWCSIGKNLGDEQDGKNDIFERPVLILKKFNERIAWILPLTSQIKKGKYYCEVFANGRMQTVILSQLRLVSIKRFRHKACKIPRNIFDMIRIRIKQII